MRALKDVADEHGVTHMAAICAICKAQFSKVLPQYGFEMDGIVSVHQMVSNAILLTGSTQAEEFDAQHQPASAQRREETAMNDQSPNTKADASPFQERREHVGSRSISPRRSFQADKILQVPDLRASHAAVPGRLPVRPRHLAAGSQIARGMDKPPVAGHARGSNTPSSAWSRPIRSRRPMGPCSPLRRARTAATATRSTISSASTRSSNMSATGRSRTERALPAPPGAIRQEDRGDRRRARLVWRPPISCA